jgi:agmatinase
MTVKGPRRNCGFVGIPTFLRSSHCEQIETASAEWAVLGMPYDEGSPFAPGSRFAPRSIREQSLRFRSSGVYDAATREPVLDGFVASSALIDAGDVDVLPSNPERTLENLCGSVKSLLARGIKPLVIGGDHAISYPVLRAFQEPLHVIQIDAHLDYMPVSEELKHTNGQGFRKIHALPHVASLTQIGIRGLRNYESDFRDAEDNGSHIVTMRKLRKIGPEEAIVAVPQGAPCYVSIDIDAYDSSLTPGCVSAEPGGILWDDMCDLLGAIAARVDVRGFDLVEVNPMLDVGTAVTSYLAAATIIRFLGYAVAARSLRAAV